MDDGVTETKWFKEYDTRDGMGQGFKNDTCEHEWNDNIEDKKQINANTVYIHFMR